MSLGTMKKGIAVFAFAVVGSFAAMASAQAPGIYFTPKVGYSHLQADGHINAFDGPYYFTPTSTVGPVNYGTISSAVGRDKASKGQVVLGLAVGYDFNSVYAAPIRAEFEYAWRDKNKWQGRGKWNENNTAEVGTQSFFVNLYFDSHNSTPLTPYIGGGLGLARVDARAKGFGVNDIINIKATNLAWNVGGGAAWAINDHISLDLGYRYADFGNVGKTVDFDLGAGLSFHATFDADITTHEVLMGLRYTF